MATPILEIQDLHTYFKTKDGVVKAVNGVSLRLEENRVLGVVGESGSGKTVTALSIMQLVPIPGEIVKGQIRYDGVDLLGLTSEQMRHLRGREISLIFQDAGAALNPVISIGQQVEEILQEHTDMSRRRIRDMATDLLHQMGIPDARTMMGRYPFQLSGGMAQRVLLAIGMALKPRILVADEPTSNLDVTLQAEMLHRMRQLREESNTAILLITHDLGVIAQMADTVAVMYGGTIVEYADTRALYSRPLHPYTWGLFQAMPRLDSDVKPLKPIRGAPPKMLDAPDVCPFLERCHKAVNQCRTGPAPKLIEVEPGHQLACYNPMVYD
ncbi:MAG: ABC transporter ATP-binding protein [Chloroflexi bacterium]|nr:ABC transporter ATP-binding protein [Chloroflexota bacterium]